MVRHSLRALSGNQRWEAGFCHSSKSNASQRKKKMHLLSARWLTSRVCTVNRSYEPGFVNSIRKLLCTYTRIVTMVSARVDHVGVKHLRPDDATKFFGRSALERKRTQLCWYWYLNWIILAAHQAWLYDSSHVNKRARGRREWSSKWENSLDAYKGDWELSERPVWQTIESQDWVIE